MNIVSFQILENSLDKFSGSKFSYDLYYSLRAMDAYNNKKRFFSGSHKTESGHEMELGHKMVVISPYTSKPNYLDFLFQCSHLMT